MMCWDTDMRKFSPAVLRCDLLSQISRFDLLEVEMIVFATLSTLNNFSSALKKKPKKKRLKAQRCDVCWGSYQTNRLF